MRGSTSEHGRGVAWRGREGWTPGCVAGCGLNAASSAPGSAVTLTCIYCTPASLPTTPHSLSVYVRRPSPQGAGAAGCAAPLLLAHLRLGRAQPAAPAGAGAAGGAHPGHIRPGQGTGTADNVLTLPLIPLFLPRQLRAAPRARCTRGLLGPSHLFSLPTHHRRRWPARRGAGGPGCGAGGTDQARRAAAAGAGAGAHRGAYPRAHRAGHAAAQVGGWAVGEGWSTGWRR